MPQNLIEKIAQKYAKDLPKGYFVKSGDYINIEPAYVMTHDNTGAVIPKFKEIGVKKLYNADQVVITLDHNIQDKSEKNLKKYKEIENFAKNMGAHFYPAGRGIGHQVMCEEGFVEPGTFVVASDSHSNMYGGLGALGTAIVRTDAAAIWATGRMWWQVPNVVKVEFRGFLQNGVSGKDVIIALCGFLNKDEVLNSAIEFCGEGLKSLSIDERLTISNMTTEWGAVAAVFPSDKILKSWLEKKLSSPPVPIRAGQFPARTMSGRSVLKTLSADSEAFYSQKITVDLASIESYVAGPNDVKKIVKVSELAKKNIKINKAYLLSCVNARLSDFEIAAKILKNKKVAEGLEFYIAAASSKIEKEAKEKGFWQDLVAAGAIELPSCCGPCIGLGIGLLKDAEVGISATNRNFKGRMGSSKAECYLASPATVAYSVIEGRITGGEGERVKDKEEGGEVYGISYMVYGIDNRKLCNQDIIDGFPKIIEGEIVFCPKDNMNTDGIYPGKYTYQDDLTPEDQKKVVMENYDPSFSEIAKRGDILVSGVNFGTGSSREQAVTALKYFGIKLIVAGSFSDTYKRNAFNNGFICIECPEFVKILYGKLNKKVLTLRIGLSCKIDFVNSVLECEAKKYPINSLGKLMQQLIMAGSLERFVFGAGDRNRTDLNSLEGCGNSHYTTPA